MGAMAQAGWGHGVNAAFPEGKLIKGHEIRCVATTAGGTCGALLRGKASHQAQDDVFLARRGPQDEPFVCDLARMMGSEHGGHRQMARPVDLADLDALEIGL